MADVVFSKEEAGAMGTQMKAEHPAWPVRLAISSRCLAEVVSTIQSTPDATAPGICAASPFLMHEFLLPHAQVLFQ